MNLKFYRHTPPKIEPELDGDAGPHEVLSTVVADMFGPYPTEVAWVIRLNGKLRRKYMGVEFEGA